MPRFRQPKRSSAPWSDWQGPDGITATRHAEIPRSIPGRKRDHKAAICLLQVKPPQLLLFCGPRWHGRTDVMRFRLLTHVLVLALFVTATMMAAFVPPAKAGYGGMGGETLAAMSAEMPCCPNAKDKQPDCTTNCLAVSFCLAKCYSSAPTGPAPVVQAFVLLLRLAGNETLRVSRPAEPPARPPRS